MDLAPNGIDIYYIDESERHPLSVASSVCVPFLRPKKDSGGWEFVWGKHLDSSLSWRRSLSRDHSIRFREELHGYKILRHQGLYHKSHRNLSPTEATALYKGALSSLDWLPNGAIMSASATDNSELMGHRGIAACLLGLFQRIRNDCNHRKVNALMFFDEGHSSYIRLYRMAQKYLPVGSKLGGWEGGKRTKNLPLSMFPKDANTKSSELSYFLQVADLVSYAARLKLENERGSLAAKRIARDHHKVYDSIPIAKLNRLATFKRNDAIVPT
ncbi:DUF3800 domain-containing protein [Bradyrhizobium brasilense]|uniref:DUF3800 domain-containing protein n=1 Tax=Bradyrhizobium brasilense TaxID=1419277 RepID=UPI0024B17440|nr:DUF3800 domain-containing protein [Bradyrhizobium australafricanum]WFU33065.1 DUF3800 domain-containing protein [Bradyrhizobium australafricanum]